MRHLSSLLVAFLTIVCAGFSHAEGDVQRPTLTFERAIHFIAGDGSDLQVAAGTYGVEQAAQQRLRLLPGDNQAPVEIQAASISHEESLSAPVSMAVIEEGQDDQVHLVFLLPDGRGLDAVGSYSGVSSRAVVKALGRVQVHSAVRQRKAVQIQTYAAVRVPAAAAAVKPVPPSESVETSADGHGVTWNYLLMHHPELVAQALADVQTSKQPRASVAGLASEVELNDMLKTNWSVEVRRLNAMRTASTTQAGVTPRGFADGLSLTDQVTAVTPQKSPLIAIWKAMPMPLPTRNLGSVWAGQRATAVVSITAPADGYVEGRFNLNATNRHFRIVNAKAYTGEVVTGTLAVSLTIPGGQYQDVVPDPSNPPAQISKAGFVAILAKNGQRIDFTVAFEPVGLGMTPVGDNEATLQLSGATSTEINILSNAPAATWTRAASIHARFEGINFGVLGTVDDTAITQFYDGTPCGRLVPVPASITFFNAEQQARNVSVTTESLAPALHVQPFTVSLAPGERKQVHIPLQIDSCPHDGIEQTGTIKYAYAGIVRRAVFGVTLYPGVLQWSKSGAVGYCHYTWDVFAYPDGTRQFVYSLKNTHLIYSMRLEFHFFVLNTEIGQPSLEDGPGPQIQRNSYATKDNFMRDNYARLFSEPLQTRLRCQSKT